MMSKRKNRASSPNIPQAALDRAREQLLGEQETAPVKSAETAPAPKPQAAAPASASAVRSRRQTTSGGAQTRRARAAERTDMSIVRDRLDHPTRIVTEAELRQEYGYVLQDLRSMGILAAVLVVLLVLIAQFI